MDWLKNWGLIELANTLISEFIDESNGCAWILMDCIYLWPIERSDKPKSGSSDLSQVLAGKDRN